MIAEGKISVARINEKGCVALLNEAIAPNCPVHSPGKPTGEVLSEKIQAEIALVGTVEHSDLIKFVPVTGQVYLILELGSKCAIGESVKVESIKAGEGFWLADAKGNTSFLMEAVTHLVREGLETMKALGVPVKTIGSALVELTGVHEGLKMVGCAGLIHIC